MSATSPAPLPRSSADGADEPEDADRACGGARPALSLARGASVPEAVPWDAPAREGSAGGRLRPPTDHDAGLRVRLVPRVEPPASPVRAHSPAHERPPLLGTPEALARDRVPAHPVDAWGDAGDAGTRPGPLPDPTRLCCGVVQAAVEGLRGVRPLAQLTRWVTPEVYDRLALRAQLVKDAAVAPSAARAAIRRVRVCRIGPSAAEATVVVEDGPRIRAVALRVEEHRGRWRATALEIG